MPVLALALALAGQSAGSQAEMRRCDVAGPCLTPTAYHGRRYDGLFILWYQQIHCRKAPCPKSGWAISLAREKAPGERNQYYLPIRIGHYLYAPGTPAALRLDPGQDGKVTIDGVVEISADRSVATIRPRTARFGNPPYR